MSKRVRYAGVVAVAVTFITTAFSTVGSGVSAQTYEPTVQLQHAVQLTSEPAPLAPPAEQAIEQAPEAPVEQADDKPAPPRPEKLSEAVADASASAELSREMQCLAGAIYFEAKGESLEGQLAVGRVVVARSKSGRFPGSYCGVVYQPSQFSFVRGKSMPPIDKSSRSWATAVKMAKIADQGSMKSPAEGALFFHAARVSPGWRLTRVARIDNHIFYR